VAKLVQERLPTLESLQPKLTGESMPELLKRSVYAVEVARTKEAIDLAIQAMAVGTLSRSDAERALFVAGKFGSPEAFRAVFQGYERSMQGSVPEAVQQGYRMRQETARRLLALWPSLGLQLPKL
jgi:hypothetical protein